LQKSRILHLRIWVGSRPTAARGPTSGQVKSCPQRTRFRRQRSHPSAASRTGVGPPTSRTARQMVERLGVASSGLKPNASSICLERLLSQAVGGSTDDANRMDRYRSAKPLSALFRQRQSDHMGITRAAMGRRTKALCPQGVS